MRQSLVGAKESETRDFPFIFRTCPIFQTLCPRNNDRKYAFSPKLFVVGETVFFLTCLFDDTEGTSFLPLDMSSLE